ncbi:MAG: biotin/lipoate--protein ligase family protein [Hyphomicrobiaceae bacterium]
MTVPDPTFPPLIEGVGVNGPDRPVVVACKGAAAGDFDAGTLVWARNHDIAECALVLAPEVDGVRACEMARVWQLTIIEALGLVMPSQTAVQVRWPSTILCNGGDVGATCLVSPEAPGHKVPDWIVAGAKIVVRRNLGGLEPGIVRDETALAEEDGGNITRSDVISTIASHMVANIHDWEQDGFRGIVERWLGRVEGRETAADMLVGGVARRCKVVGLGDALTLLASDDSGRALAIPDVVSLWPDQLPVAFARPTGQVGGRA